MDLTDISYRQALSDTNLANRRVVDISLKLKAASRELDSLRKELESLSTEIHVQIEALGGIAHTDPSVPVMVPAGAELRFTGWIVCTKVMQRLTKAVVVLTDARPGGRTSDGAAPTPIHASCNVTDRHDVAQHFSNPDTLRSGFDIVIGARQVPPGPFEARLDVHTEEGRILTKPLGNIQIVSAAETPQTTGK